MTETLPTTLVWLRRDLRLADHPALAFAAQRGRVVPVYILEESEGDPWPMGGAMRWWLHHTLTDLAERFEKLGVPLVLRRGDPLKILSALVQEAGADCVVFSRRTDALGRTVDAAVEKALVAAGVEVKSFNASLLFESWDISTKAGGPFKVYTPFSKACFAATVGLPVPAPKKMVGVAGLSSDRLQDFSLLPTHPDWGGMLQAHWKAGEASALKRLGQFIDTGLASYKTMRDRPDQEGTSCLSPYLAVGAIGPRQIWHAVQNAMASRQGIAAGAEVFLKELLWREFSHHLLYYFPHLPEKPLAPAFAQMKWRRSKADLAAWQKGMTGYPIVDAGMRQLWQTGWMHNRVRMIVASFLIKDLLIPWQQGEAWFWDTLIDSDMASNAASWQWVAGCGADAAPFFRVFNPVLQGKKFDPDGAYVRRFVPELSGLQGPALHAPWLLSHEALAQAGVTLGKTYPTPIVDHAAARQRVLAAFRGLR